MSRGSQLDTTTRNSRTPSERNWLDWPGSPQNWDRYGAPCINPRIIDAARKFIRALPENIVYRPRVVPMSTGNLQFEWHHGHKVLELEFETQDTIHFLQYHPEENVEEEDTFRASEIDRAVDLIQWFMSGTNCP